MLILGDLGNFINELYNGIFSWQFLQFVVLFISIFGFVLTSATLLVLAERKVMAWMQDRLGPYHTGPWGLLQTVADVGKLLLKEDIHAGQTDKAVFLFAPSVFLAPVIAAFAVLPFSPYLTLPGSALATGLVYLVAMSSLDVVGVVMAGWASNNKYSLIGGLRSAAQMISYELPLVLALVGVVMLTSVLDPHGPGVGTISLRGIMDFQVTGVYPGRGNAFWDFVFQGFTPWAWFFLVQPLMLLIYYTCGLAETNRAPFDLPEMFFLGEYGNMTIVSAIASLLFLGGFSGPGVSYLTGLNNIWWGLLGNLLALGYFIIKIYSLCFVFIWIRSTLPRLRADQLMQFAWLILIPTTLLNIVVTGGLYLLLNSLGASNLVFLIALGVLNWIMLFGFIWVVQRATVATTRSAQAPAIRARQRTVAARLAARDAVPQLPEESGIVTGAQQ
jgi:NADH-quinone oxidoreductase subunit H